MVTIDTTKETRYSPLIPALTAIFQAKTGENLQIIMDDEKAFSDLKEYLSGQNIGFREVYDENLLILQFKV